MYKLGVFTDEIDQDFQRAVDVALEFGLKGLEIRSVWDTSCEDLTPEQIARMKDIINGTRLVVCSIGSPFYKCDIDSPEERAEHLNILKRCIRLAGEFDCKVIRGFTFWRKGKAADRWQEILDAYDEPARLAAEAGVAIGIENESATMIGTGEETARFIRELDRHSVRVTWDCANAHDDGEVPYPDGYEHVKDLICHVHLKDAWVNPETGKRENCPVGEGEIDIAGEFVALAKDGYEDYVSLETHWRPSALDEDTLNRPGGSAFSLNAETASRICLQNIQKTLKDLHLELG